MLVTSGAAMVMQMQKAFDHNFDGLAWEVTLEDGELVWHDKAAGGRVAAMISL